jgi:protein phosphatase
MLEILQESLTPTSAVEALIAESLDNGAPDNVTVVVVDIANAETPGTTSNPITVGSAAQPLAFDAPAGRRVFRIPTVALRHPIKAVAGATTEEAHFEPDSEEYLEQLIAEDARRARLRRLRWLFILLLVLVITGVLLFFGYLWTQTRYFVGEMNGQVAIWQGVQQDVGPIELSTLHEVTDIEVDTLPAFYQQRLEATISASSLAEAELIVERISNVGD